MHSKTIHNLKFPKETIETLEQVIPYLRENSGYLDSLYRECFNKQLRNSSHPVANIIYGRYSKLKPYQIIKLSSALEIELEHDKPVPTDYSTLVDNSTSRFLLMYTLSDDTTQQLICSTLFLRHRYSDDNITPLEDSDTIAINHFHTSYNYEFSAYGYLHYNIYSHSFCLELREFDPFFYDSAGFRTSNKSKSEKFFNNEGFRRYKMEMLVKSLKRSRIRYLDLGEWLGLTTGISVFIIDTYKEFDYHHLSFTRGGLIGG